MKIFDGRKIRDIRKKLGLTQNMLATNAGITREHLSEIERGRSIPRANTIARLAEALNVEESSFFLSIEI